MRLIFWFAFLTLFTVCFSLEHDPTEHHKLDPNVKPLIIPLTQKMMSGKEIAQLHKEHQKFNGKEDIDKNGGRKDPRLLQYIYKKDYLLADVTIGYPSNVDADCVKFQKFQLSLETGHKDTFVFSNEFKLLNKTVQKVYNPTASAVSEFVNKNFKARTGNLIINGSIYRDILNIQNYIYKSEFGVADSVHTIEKRGRVGFPIDGVLGVSITNNTDTTTLIDYLCQELRQKHVYCWYTLWVGAHKKPSDGSSKGILTIFGTDSVHCGAPASWIQYVTVKQFDQDNRVPMFEMPGFQFGSFKYSTSKFASIDSGFSEIILPIDVYNSVFDLIDPFYDTKTNLLTIDCGKIGNLPDLTFTPTGYYKDFKLNVTSINYVLDLDLPNNQCAVAIGPQQGFYASEYVLGSPFIRSYCVGNELYQERYNIYFYTPK